MPPDLSTLRSLGASRRNEAHSDVPRQSSEKVEEAKEVADEDVVEEIEEEDVAEEVEEGEEDKEEKKEVSSDVNCDIHETTAQKRSGKNNILHSPDDSQHFFVQSFANCLTPA